MLIHVVYYSYDGEVLVPYFLMVAYNIQYVNNIIMVLSPLLSNNIL